MTTNRQLPLLLVCYPAHADHTPAWLTTPLGEHKQARSSHLAAADFCFWHMEAAMLLAGHLTGWRYNLDGYWGALDYALEAFAASTLMQEGRYVTGQVPGVALGVLPSSPPPALADLTPQALADQFIPEPAFTQGSDPIRRDVFLPFASDMWVVATATAEILIRPPATEPRHPAHVNAFLARFFDNGDQAGASEVASLVARNEPRGVNCTRELLQAIATAPRWSSSHDGERRIRALLASFA